jgi:hypothetical protein
MELPTAGTVAWRGGRAEKAVLDSLRMLRDHTGSPEQSDSVQF